MENQQCQIISTSRKNIKASLKYKQEVNMIKKTAELKYHDSIKNEKNIFNRIILLFKKRNEIRKKIHQLTSLDKLYLR